MGFFPNKQFNTGHPPEDWEKQMRVTLNKNLDNKLFTVKTRTGSKIMQKSPYIEYLISQEKIKRLKNAIPVEEEDNDGLPMSKMSGEDEK